MLASCGAHFLFSMQSSAAKHGISENTHSRRSANDYSAEELRYFQQQFMPKAQRYRKWWRGFRMGMLLLFPVVFISGLILPHPEYGFILIGIGLTALLVAVFFYPPLHCPACQSHLEVEFGQYCPQCCTTGLIPADQRDFPCCKNCGDLRRGKGGRNYKIRFCSRCGIPVDQRGV